MKLNDLLSPYKYFFRAEEKDNQDILDFFNAITMDTSDFSVRYDRGLDFFAFTREQSKDVVVFIMRDEKGLVKGTASICFLPHTYNGKKEIFAYLGDLRISPTLSAKIRINWKKCYSEIIEHFSAIEEFKGVKYLYSAILDDNQNAMISLLKNNDQLIYQRLTAYQTFNVLKKDFFQDKNLINQSSRFQIEWLSANDPKLLAFYRSNVSPEGLAPFYTHQNPEQCELTYHLKNWKGLDQSKALVIIDRSTQNIMAATIPWMCETKKLVIERMSTKQKLLSWLSPLVGIPSLKESQGIQVLYLTHLHFALNSPLTDRSAILTKILNALFDKYKKEKRDFHVISFFVFDEWNLEKLPFMIEKTKAQFYQVMSKKQFDENDFINLKKNAPAFEIGSA
jgi:hypothetical protein